MHRRALFAGLITTGLLQVAPSLYGGDWPQILGPQRNGQTQDETLAAQWPADGPPELWQLELGTGYAGPAVVDGTVYLFHRQDDAERLMAASLAEGKVLWTCDMRATYRPSINPDDGPRCVPIITPDAVVVYGAAGQLRGIDRVTGKLRWEVDLADKFAAPEGYFGVGSTPLVVDSKVLVNVGGRNGAGIVAVHLKDGTIAWQATDTGASYASPTLATIGGKQYAVFVTRYAVVVLDPADGKVLYEFPYGQRGPTVNAATPLVFDEQLFLTASYGVGAKLIRLGAETFTPVWENDTSLSSQYNTPVKVGDYLYGIHGREDLGVPELRCIEAATGKVKWAEPGLGTAHLISADGKLIAVTNDGTAILFRPDPEKFTEISRFSAAQDAVRALPALADGRLLIRQTGPAGGPVRCFQIAPSRQ